MNNSDSSDSIQISEIQSLLHPLFSGIPSPPSRIWVEGKKSAFRLLDRLPEDGLAVVGTRNPERRATFLTEESIARLKGSSRIILSGLARGIDAVAHEAALAVGLPTIAILGCGIRRTYPPENRRLRTRILEAGGLVISEFDPDLEARAGCFIQRNRLIAGFAKATWVVQSGYRSGALNTAHWALRQARMLYVTPSFPGDPSFLGNQNLLAQQASIAFWSAESLTSTWISLFSQVETNRLRSLHSPSLDLLLEIETGLKKGKDLMTLIRERSERTGESIDQILLEIEKHGRG